MLALFAAFLRVTCGTLPKKNLELITRKKKKKKLLLKNLYVSFSWIKRPRLCIVSNFALSARKLRAKRTAQTEPW